MKFYKIDCQDKIIIQRRNGLMSSTDEGRVYFNQPAGQMMIDDGIANGIVWDSRHDGAGSGLDADVLDGEEGAFYQNAGNLNAGIIPEARLFNISPTMGLDINQNITITTDNAYSMGDPTHRFTEVHSISFEGQAVTAEWGDLAEKYICKGNCEAGTVMCVCTDDEADVEECEQDLSPICVGVISEKPGFGMAGNLEDGKYVGLVGKLPVRVRGPVYKGDFLVSTYNGCARAGHTNELPYKIGISLEEDLSDGEKLIKCIIK